MLLTGNHCFDVLTYTETFWQSRIHPQEFHLAAVRMSTPALGYTPPAVPLRTKRNFKALVLPDDPIVPTPVATRPAPLPAGKRRPPPLGGDAATNGFVLDPTIPVESPATGSRSALHATITNRLAKLDLKAAPKLDIKNADLKKLADLGQGNGGSVVKVEHVPTGTIMAKKVRGVLKRSTYSIDIVDL